MKVFEFILKIVAEHGSVKSERIGVDGSTMEANAATVWLLCQKFNDPFLASAHSFARVETPAGRSSGATVTATCPTNSSIRRKQAR